MFVFQFGKVTEIPIVMFDFKFLLNVGLFFDLSKGVKFRQKQWNSEIFRRISVN